MSTLCSACLIIEHRLPLTELRCKDNVEPVLWKSIKILNFGLDTCIILLEIGSSASNEKMSNSRITFV